MIDKFQVTVEQMDGQLHKSLDMKLVPAHGDRILLSGKAYQVIQVEFTPDLSANCDVWLRVLRVDGTDEPEGVRDDSRALALRAVLKERERELLKLKGPCDTDHCSLHYAHAGPCNVKPEAG